MSCCTLVLVFVLILTKFLPSGTAEVGVTNQNLSNKGFQSVLEEKANGYQSINLTDFISNLQDVTSSHATEGDTPTNTTDESTDLSGKEKNETSENGGVPPTSTSIPANLTGDLSKDLIKFKESFIMSEETTNALQSLYPAFSDPFGIDTAKKLEIYAQGKEIWARYYQDFRENQTSITMTK